MTALLPMHRVRIELERTLRTRAFFSRALRDELTDDEYLELLAQLGALLAVVSRDAAPELVALANDDVVSVSKLDPSRVPVPAICAAIRLFGLAAPSCALVLPPEARLDAGLTVLGTSWTRQAARRIARRTGRASSLLREVGERGPVSFSRLQESYGKRPVESQDVYAFAELTRGALLGLATYLDSIWPAPVYTMSVACKE